MAKAIIHVNQHKVKANKKTGSKDPVFTVKTYKSNVYTDKVTIRCEHCDSEVAIVEYTPDKPLSCGATAYISTDTENVELDG